MTFNNSTKGTHVYEATEDDAAIQTVYIKRAAMDNKPPPDIKISVEY